MIPATPLESDWQILSTYISQPAIIKTNPARKAGILKVIGSKWIGRKWFGNGVLYN